MEKKENETTKERLLEAAGEIFAQQGYNSATIRDICRSAGAHVGAVNYHFRDKEGLYKAVIEYSSLHSEQKYPIDMGVTESSSPEEKLEIFIRSFISRILDDDTPAWRGKLMAMEIANPTNAIDQVIEKSSRPLKLYLMQIVSEFLYGKKEPDNKNRVKVFTAATNITGQCVHYFIGREFIERLCPKDFNIEDIDFITKEIFDFSIGGLEKLRSGENK
ncbi:MAG: CerR family C-terminal domain-containing protein [Thermodesulfobacteriota bacterium]